jgi:two-component sensor histidine kinase
LIINELASNSLKHAFKGSSQKNIISITIESQINNRFNLIFSDNGIGLPPGLDLKNTESLGLELVYTLAEQLDGSIELEQSGGTTFKITFREVGNTPRFQ